MIEKYIRYLLFEHDCVVIPEFGGFIANYVSADIHPIRHTLVPPSKNIAFNEMLKLNDGLLIAYVANHERISREEAHKAVRNFVDMLKTEIRTKGKYTFAEIGILFLNQEQKLQFEPDNKVNYLSSSFALPELQCKIIERTTHYTRTKTRDRQATPNERRLEEEDDTLVFSPKRKRDSSKILLAIVVPSLLLLAGSAGYYLFLDNDNQTTGSFNPFGLVQEEEAQDTDAILADNSFLFPTDSSQVAEETTEGTPDDTWSSVDNTETGQIAVLSEKPEIISEVKPEEKATVPVTPAVTEEKKKPANPAPEKKPAPAPAPVVKEKAVKAPETAETVAKPSSPQRYYVIIGGFSVKKNAHKLRDQLVAAGNTQAKLIVPPQDNSLIKVSFADYSQAPEAYKKAEELKSEYGNTVWVMKY